MNIKTLLLLLALSLQLFCLNFGDDLSTTAPSPEQVALSKKMLNLSPNIPIKPIGLKIIGSGIDKAIWFKFSVPTRNIDNLFLSEKVSPSNFTNNFMLYPENGLKWWDVKGKTFIGSHLKLDNGTVINIGIKKENKFSVVYIASTEN